MTKTKMRIALAAGVAALVFAVPTGSVQASHPCHEDEPPSSCSHDTVLCTVSGDLSDVTPLWDKYVAWHCLY